MEYIFFVYIAITIFFLFFDMKMGVALYLIYSILVPYDLLIFSINASSFLHVFILLTLVIHSHKFFIKANFQDYVKPFVPILLLYVVLFCFTPFQQYVPFSQEFTYFQYAIRQFFILPVAIWCVTKNDPKGVNAVNTAIIIASIVVFAYEFYLLFVNGINYYLIFISNFSGHEVFEIMLGEDDSRFLIRASSTFSHSMNYAMFLLLDYVFLVSIKNKINKGLWLLLLGCCIVCIFTSNVRSAIGAFVVANALFVLLLRNKKVTIAFILGAVLLLYIIDNNQDFAFFMKSFYNKEAQFDGSTTNLRLTQLEGCFKEIANCPLFGKGYEWSTYYMAKNLSHPVIRGFESVIFKFLCNWGYVGLLIYFIANFKFTLNTYHIMKTRGGKILSISLIVVFLTYCIATGDYFYTQYLMMFYALLLANHHKTQYKLL